MLLRKRAHGRWWILVTSIPVEGIVGISMISLEQTMVHCRVNTCTEPELVRRSGKSSRYQVKQYLLSIDVNPECRTYCCRWFIHSQWLLHVDMVFTSNRNLPGKLLWKKDADSWSGSGDHPPWEELIPEDMVVPWYQMALQERRRWSCSDTGFPEMLPDEIIQPYGWRDEPLEFWNADWRVSGWRCFETLYAA